MTEPLVQAKHPAIPLEEPVLDPAPAPDAARPTGPKPWPFDPDRLAALFAAPRPRRVLLWDEPAAPRR